MAVLKLKKKDNISIVPSNPEPHWSRINQKYPIFPSDAVKVHQTSTNEVVYVAKLMKTHVDPLEFMIKAHEYPEFLTGVWKENGQFSYNEKQKFFHSTKVEIDVLKAGNYEWVKAQRGNVIPPNAVKTTIRYNRRLEEQCVGRVGGARVYGVSITDGMINYFTDIYGHNVATSGDILLLTADPSDKSSC